MALFSDVVLALAAFLATRLQDFQNCKNTKILIFYQISWHPNLTPQKDIVGTNTEFYVNI